MKEKIIKYPKYLLVEVAQNIIIILLLAFILYESYEVLGINEIQHSWIIIPIVFFITTILYFFIRTIISLFKSGDNV